MHTIIHQLIQGRHLSRAQSYDLFSSFLSESPEQQASILALMRRNGETLDEILGAQDYFLENATPLHTTYDVLDMVGTGGDGKNTFNITTAASLVVAAAGAFVAKHGGGASTSKAGSMDTLQHLKIPAATSQNHIDASLEQHHYVYLQASAFNHPFAMSSSLRKKLPFPTLFNLLGPLINPLRPKRYVIGVYCANLVNLFAKLCLEQGVTHSLVVHSYDGMDEFSISAPSKVAEIKGGTIKEYTIDPRDLGLNLAPIEAVQGGTASHNAQLIQGILSNSIHGAAQDVVALNAAAGLYVAGRAKNFKEGLAMAREALFKTIPIPGHVKNLDETPPTFKRQTP